MTNQFRPVTSIWELAVDPNEAPSKGVVTGAAASRLGAHVGARILQLQQSNVPSDKAANHQSSSPNAVADSTKLNGPVKSTKTFVNGINNTEIKPNSRKKLTVPDSFEPKNVLIVPKTTDTKSIGQQNFVGCDVQTSNTKDCESERTKSKVAVARDELSNKSGSNEETYKNIKNLGHDLRGVNTENGEVAVGKGGSMSLPEIVDNSIATDASKTDAREAEEGVRPVPSPKSILVNSGKDASEKKDWTAPTKPRFSISFDEHTTAAADSCAPANIQETIHLKTITTPEQTLELTLTVADVSKFKSIAPPPQKKKVGFESDHDASRRGSLVDPNLIQILPGDDDTCDACRRNSEPFVNVSNRPSLSLDFKPHHFRDRASDSKRGSFFSNDNLEAISLKLDAIVVNAEYLEKRSCDADERHELEEDVARTQAALDDVAGIQEEHLQERIARAARALTRCRLLLEERAPSIASHEPEYRRRSSVADQVTRSVALRVLALEGQLAARKRLDSRSSADSRRGSLDSRRGSLDYLN